MRFKLLILLSLVAVVVFAQEEGNHDNLALLVDSDHIVRMESLNILPSEKPVSIDVGFYGAVNAGIFQSVLPSLGTSIRAQKGENGAELDFSVFPYNWKDADAGLSYKLDCSYLYHFKGKRSGVYLGGGPGFLTNRRVFRPLAVTWVGYQFSSQFLRNQRIHGFADGGITSLLESDREVIIFVPTVRGGAGFSF